MVGLGDPVLALDFDLAATARLLERERQATEEAMGSGDESGEPKNTQAVFW